MTRRSNQGWDDYCALNDPLLRLTPTEFMRLAAEGRAMALPDGSGPREWTLKEVRAVAVGTKPVALFPVFERFPPELVAAEAAGLLVARQRIRDLPTKHHVIGGIDCAVARGVTELRAFFDADLGPPFGLARHIRMGRALGYNSADIAAHVVLLCEGYPKPRSVGRMHDEWVAHIVPIKGEWEVLGRGPGVWASGRPVTRVLPSRSSDRAGPNRGSATGGPAPTSRPRPTFRLR